VKTVLLINGPNLNTLGKRQPEIYGSATLAEIVESVSREASRHDIHIKPFQSNHEGAIIDFIQAEADAADGIIINPGALTHCAYSLRDCLAAVDCPVIEVHISNIQKREEWRKKSVLAEVCTGMIGGLGVKGYVSAVRYFRDE